MNNNASTKKRHRVNIDVEPGFETKVRLLAARWGVKTNVAIQRAIDQANARQRPDDESALIKATAARTEQILELLFSA